jgi:hypothetical protein
VPLTKMAYNTPDHTFVLLAREPNSLEFGSIVATLRFTVKEIDPSTGAQPPPPPSPTPRLARRWLPWTCFYQVWTEQ